MLPGCDVLTLLFPRTNAENLTRRHSCRPCQGNKYRMHIGRLPARVLEAVLDPLLKNIQRCCRIFSDVTPVLRWCNVEWLAITAGYGIEWIGMFIDEVTAPVEQLGDKMNCNQKFAINRLGPNATGGCNPVYLAAPNGTYRD